MLWIAFALLAGIVVATVILPLAKSRGKTPPRAAFDRAVYRDQLREIDLDRERGLLTEAEAESARLEIERRLLGTASHVRAIDASAPASPAHVRSLVLALALAVPAGAVLIYLLNGAPGVPDQPYAMRAAERALASGHGTLDLDKAAAALTERLKQDPSSADGWLLLARTQAARGHWQESAAAYHEALTLTHQRPDVAAAYGEMLVLAADGIVTPAAHDAFSVAISGEPENNIARYYLALADAQAGNAQAAIDAWQKLLAQTPGEAPWKATVRERILETAKAAGLPAPALPPAAPAPGPSTDDMAAAAQMSPQDRTQMIRGMVERLATRLKSDPGDLDGWMRLGRAYEVLGEHDKAAEAYGHAETLRPNDPDVLSREVDARLGGREPSTPITAADVALLKRLEKLDPDEPRALWYLGLAAAQGHRKDEAKSYWQRLLATLPPESPERRTVSAAIGALDRSE